MLRGAAGAPAWEAPVVGRESEQARATWPGRWVVTSSDARYWNFLTIFLGSLRDVARHTGPVAVFDYGLTGDQRQRLGEADVLVLEPRKKHVLVVDRYLSLAGEFRGDKESLILYFDADVWFADRIDELFTDPEIVGGKLAAAKDVWFCDYYLRCTTPEHHATVTEALNEIVRDYGQTLQAGFIAGGSEAWLRYAALLQALLAEGFAGNGWGADALALNLYSELYARFFRLLPITYNAPPLWGVVREGARFFATKFDTDSLYRPEQGRIPIKVLHMTDPVRGRNDHGLRFGDVYPEALAQWESRLGGAGA